MNEQAQKILVDLLQKASNGIDSAVSFSQAQIPDVIQQLLMWHVVSSAAIQVACVLGIIILCWLAVKVARVMSKNIDDIDFMMVIHCAIAVIIIILLIVICFHFDWLKIWLAPKLYLIEYAASLVK